MICLLLIMTMIFINSSDTTEQKLRHSDTLLKEEDMNAKTKAWLLMVESGKVDQEELRRITPKSIFIAPLLSSRAGKCKEGYRHDHLGQCVKVIKIDPQVQLELLLEKLNKLYGDKKEEKEREKEEELFEVSSGPLHFSLPIYTADEKVGQAAAAAAAADVKSSAAANATVDEGQNVPEFMAMTLHQNGTNQTKELESSGVGPFTEMDAYEGSHLEGSGSGQGASGGGLPEDEEDEQVGTTALSPVSLLPEEADYLDATEMTSTEVPTTTEPTEEDTTTAEAEPPFRESYQNVSSVNNVNTSTAQLSKESVRDEIPVRNKSNSEKIYFPREEGEVGRTATKPPPRGGGGGGGGRIRFPDEVDQRHPSSYLTPTDAGTKSSKYQIHSSAIPREQFWWLPKNWQVVDDDSHHKSALVKVWSRLPLIHDITYTGDATRRPQPPPSSTSPDRPLKPFKSSRFQDILMTPRQNIRFQR